MFNRRKINLLKITEILLISFVWIVMIAAPVLFNRQAGSSITWQMFITPMGTIIPLFLIFLINRFILVPGLLFKNNSILYGITVAALIVICTIGTFIYQNQFNTHHPPSQSTGILNDRRMERPPFPPEGRNDENFHPPQKAPYPDRMPPFANILIFSVLIVGFDTGLKASFRWAESEREKARLEKENISIQLDALRNQVSPHFFMNTLNNIHTLIDISSEKAKDAVIKLSKMMRYLLYDTAQGETTLQKEITFIESYIELMKLRVSDKVEISITMPHVVKDVPIPPLLFTSFIENAFKYGISYQQKSFIHIELIQEEEQILFHIKNSKNTTVDNRNSTGIGIENARSRMNLLFGTKHRFVITETESTFAIDLSIPL